MLRVETSEETETKKGPTGVVEDREVGFLDGNVAEGTAVRVHRDVLTIPQPSIGSSGDKHTL